MPVGRSTYCVWSNWFRRTGISRDKSAARCCICRSFLRNRPTLHYVQFSPQDVMLSRDDIAGISARNHLRGQIRQFVELPERVFVAVDIGQIIWCELTPESMRRIGPAARHRDRVPGEDDLDAVGELNSRRTWSPPDQNSLMPDDISFDEIDDVFGNVRGMIGYALDIAADREEMHGWFDQARSVLHAFCSSSMISRLS